jgi:hypothetical protein
VLKIEARHPAAFAHPFQGFAARDVLLMCGVLASLVYVATDIAASILYPGYSYRDQAISELFAIGAPTGRLVVPLFTLSSLLIAAFAAGIWLSSAGRLAVKIMVALVFGNALDSLLLWNLFPMHMRGVQPTFTDTMHGLLATNPFVLFTIIVAAYAFRGWFRLYSIGTIAALLLPAVFAFTYLTAVMANEPTPFMGLTERVSQYSHQLWQAVFAVVLLSVVKNRTGAVIIAP